jgi:hypothetical protein
MGKGNEREVRGKTMRLLCRWVKSHRTTEICSKQS